jgi:hypothetical protein
MVFIEWWLVRRVVYGLALIALGAFAFWRVRRKGPWPRLLTRSFSLGNALIGSLFVMVGIIPIGCLSYSPPIYSPNGRMAARIRTSDLGAIGGHNDVEVRSLHGFKQDDVFLGGCECVDRGDVRWLNSSELTISYSGDLRSCTSTASVKVHCIAKEKAAH